MQIFKTIVVCGYILGLFFVPAFIVDWIYWKLSKRDTDKPDTFLYMSFIIFAVSLFILSGGYLNE